MTCYDDYGYDEWLIEESQKQRTGVLLLRETLYSYDHRGMIAGAKGYRDGS